MSEFIGFSSSQLSSDIVPSDHWTADNSQCFVQLPIARWRIRVSRTIRRLCGVGEWVIETALLSSGGILGSNRTPIATETSIPPSPLPLPLLRLHLARFPWHWSTEGRDSFAGFIRRPRRIRGDTSSRLLWPVGNWSWRNKEKKEKKKESLYPRRVVESAARWVFLSESLSSSAWQLCSLPSRRTPSGKAPGKSWWEREATTRHSAVTEIQVRTKFNRRSRDLSTYILNDLFKAPTVGLGLEWAFDSVWFFFNRPNSENMTF